MNKSKSKKGYKISSKSVAIYPFKLMLGIYDFLTSGGPSPCHTCCETVSRFDQWWCLKLSGLLQKTVPISLLLHAKVWKTLATRIPIQQGVRVCLDESQARAKTADSEPNHSHPQQITHTFLRFSAYKITKSIHVLEFTLHKKLCEIYI
jgi:hypothetical protein